MAGQKISHAELVGVRERIGVMIDFVRKLRTELNARKQHQQVMFLSEDVLRVMQKLQGAISEEINAKPPVIKNNCFIRSEDDLL